MYVFQFSTIIRKLLRKIETIFHITFLTCVHFLMAVSILSFSSKPRKCFSLFLHHRMLCPFHQQFSRVNTRTQYLNALLVWISRPLNRFCGAGCPTPFWKWIQLEWLRDMAGRCNVWSLCRCWQYTFQRKIGLYMHTLTQHRLILW